MKSMVLGFFVAAALSAGCTGSAPEYSEWMLRSEINRCPDASYLDFLNGQLKWNYTTGLELNAFMDVWEREGDDAVLSYVDGWYDRMIDSTGRILTYSVGKYNLDHICPGRTLFRLYDATGKDKYLKAIHLLRSQIDGQPRTSEGGFWHKKIYPFQMWLDGLYMAEPFYAEYTGRFAEPQCRDSLYQDILNDFKVVAEHTYDPATGLYRHAWDESRSMFWCDTLTGQSAHCWGRALGWYVMAMVDVLEILPDDLAGREDVIAILRGIFNRLPEYADPATGMWYQVLDCPGREGNYLEGTCSAMFSYALLKGVRLGYLDSSLRQYADDVYDAYVRYFVREDGDGNISIMHCCAVGGLGGKQNRSGSFEYYLSEPVRDNDAKGVGPFIQASLEKEYKKKGCR